MARPVDAGLLAPATIATLLSGAGGEPIAEADVLADVERGAPQRDDGLIPLIAYVRWLHEEAVAHGR